MCALPHARRKLILPVAFVAAMVGFALPLVMNELKARKDRKK